MQQVVTTNTLEAEQGINTALLEIVADYVERHPREFNMVRWWNKQAKQPFWFRLKRRLGFNIHPDFACGTTGCVAYHTVRLGGGDLSSNIPGQAQRLLRVTDAQALRLFYSHKWPEPYKSQYQETETEWIGRAWISAQRFRHFIATNGAE